MSTPEEHIADPVDRLAARWNAADAENAEQAPVDGDEATEVELTEALPGDEPEAAEDEETPDGEAAFATLDDLLVAGDADPANLRVSIKAAGGVEEVTLAEALAGYQRDADYRRKTSAVAEERKALEAERAALQQQAAQVHNNTGATQALLEQMYSQEFAQLQDSYAGIDWHRLRQEDSGEFAAMHAQKQQAEQALTARFQGLSQQLAQQMQAAQAAQTEAMTKAQVEQQQRLFDQHPEWAEPAAWSAAQDSMRGYLSTAYQFTEQEVAEVRDARVVDIIWKAQQWDELQKAAPKVEERIQRGSLRPGPQSQQVSTRRRAQAAAHERLKRTGSQDDAVAVLVERMGGAR